MANYALVDTSGIVQNVVVWDGVTPWSPGTGLTPIPAPDGAGAVIGATWDGEKFTAPPDPA
jgi:hypothetical protein